MTPQQKQILRETWQQVEPIADTAAALFYDRLFEIDPSTRPLFRSVDLPAQRKKLMDSLAQVVQGLDHLDILVPTIQDLGRRHARYGVTAAHYETVGAALLWTLERGLGPAWTPAAAAAWSEAYALVAGVMQRGASTTGQPAKGAHRVVVS